MERRKIREGGLPFAMTSPTKHKSQEQTIDSEDEFFDCSDEEDGSYGNYQLIMAV